LLDLGKAEMPQCVVDGITNFSSGFDQRAIEVKHDQIEGPRGGRTHEFNAKDNKTRSPRLHGLGHQSAKHKVNAAL